MNRERGLREKNTVAPGGYGASFTPGSTSPQQGRSGQRNTDMEQNFSSKYQNKGLCTPTTSFSSPPDQSSVPPAVGILKYGIADKVERGLSLLEPFLLRPKQLEWLAEFARGPFIERLRKKGICSKITQGEVTILLYLRSFESQSIRGPRDCSRLIKRASRSFKCYKSKELWFLERCEDKGASTFRLKEEGVKLLTIKFKDVGGWAGTSRLDDEDKKDVKEIVAEVLKLKTSAPKYSGDVASVYQSFYRSIVTDQEAHIPDECLAKAKCLLEKAAADGIDVAIPERLLRHMPQQTELPFTAAGSRPEGEAAYLKAIGRIIEVLKREVAAQKEKAGIMDGKVREIKALENQLETANVSIRRDIEFLQKRGLEY